MGGMFSALVLYRNLANPLGIGLRATKTGQAVFIIARGYAGIAIIRTLIGVDEHAPTDIAGHSLVGGFSAGDSGE